MECFPRIDGDSCFAVFDSIVAYHYGLDSEEVADDRWDLRYCTDQGEVAAVQLNSLEADSAAVVAAAAAAKVWGSPFLRRTGSARVTNVAPICN